MNDTYETQNIGEVAALMLHNQKIKAIHKDGKIRWFSFDKSETCEELVQKYYLDGLTGDLRKFKDCLDQVKRMVHR